MTKKYKGIVEINNSDYHAEKEHLSSSNLKLLLKDPEDFYKSKILGEAKEYSTNTLNAFAEGSYAHALILEPEVIEEEFRFFDGWRKQGKEWEKFKAENSGYDILSKPQKVRVEKWVRAYSELPAATNLIEGGKAEHTLFGKLMDVPIKVRADYINIERGYIADVKTTSSPADIDSFKYTIDSFNYDLSAALYSMMFESHYKKDFDFYFIVLSKRDSDCQVYKVSDDTRKRGESMVIQALSTYKKCKKSGLWVLPNKIKSDKVEDEGEYQIQEI